MDAGCTVGWNQTRLSETRTDLRIQFKQNQTAKATLKTIPLKKLLEDPLCGYQEMGLIFSANVDKQ